MANETTKNRVIGTTVPMEFIRTIDGVIKNADGMYKDRAEFIRDALREKIAKMKGDGR